MAVLTTDQFDLVYKDGVCGRTGLYAVKNVTAGDTMDIGTHFKAVKRAGLVSDTGTTIASVSASGTVLTVPSGPSADAVWVIVVGVAA